MSKNAGYWQALWQRAFTPRVAPEKLDEALAQARRALPQPVFWLLGKAQSGKTSIIRALTGRNDVEIGNGFRPCTRAAQLYPFPDPQRPFLQFLDTRGLGETAYDPTDDMRWSEDQAHLLVVVIKALDHAQECVLAALRAIREAHPQWPVLVVQTSLHEGYPDALRGHTVPYPYDQSPWPATVPADLARSLRLQREWFTGMNARFVAVDFTLPGDGFDPQHYGLEALWTAIEELLPLGLRAMLADAPHARRLLRDAHFSAAHPHVIAYALTAGTMGAIPLPVDLPLILAVQAKMFHAIARIYGQPPGGRWIGEIGGILGAGALARYFARLLSRDLFKLVPVPGLGSVASALMASSSTYALGLTLCAYFSYIVQGDVPDAKALRALYREQFSEGRRVLAGYLQQLPGGKEPPT